MDDLPSSVCAIVASHVRDPAGLRASNNALRAAVDETVTAISVKAGVPIGMLRRLVDLFGRTIANVRFPASGGFRDSTSYPEQLRLLDAGCPALTGMHFNWIEGSSMHLLSMPVFARLQRLSVEYLMVTDIGALSSLTGLTSLIFGAASPDDLGPLSSLSGLQNLSIRVHSHADLQPLSALTGLTSLSFDNSLGRVSIAPLASLSGLRSLSMGFANGVDDLRPLSSLTELTQLDLLGMDTIASFAPLACLTALRHLAVTIRADAGSVICTLPCLTSLRTLGVVRKGVLANCAVLEKLEAQVCGRLNVSALPVSLKKLAVWDSPTPSMAGISRLTSLAALQIIGTGLTDADLINVAQLSALSSICFTECAVYSIDALRHLSSLQLLDISYTNVADLEPLASVTSMCELDIRGSDVKSIRPLLALPRLRELGLDADTLYDGVELLSPVVKVVHVSTLFDRM